MAVPKEALELHNKLMTELNDYVNKDVDHNDYEKVRNRLKTKLTPLALKTAGDKHIMDMIDKLEKRGEVKPGKYDTLIDIFDDIDKRCGDMIKEREIEIKRIIDQDRKRKENSPEREAQSIKTLRRDVSDRPKPNEYEMRDNQKGLVLLFNYKKDREASEHDVKKIKDFFEDIKFDVRLEEEDLTEDRFKEVLEEKKTWLNIRSEAERYYCLFVIVMAHGNKSGILTSDKKTLPLSDIVNNFKNDQIEMFAGKPKVFIFQSCRGDKGQGIVDLPDEQPVDEADIFEKVSVPYDSDMLIACATTPGYIAFRRTGYGAWFIGSLIETFRDKYHKDHVEEMLIDVREKVVSDFTTPRDSKKVKQMPYTISTLRKRLFLSKE